MERCRSAPSGTSQLGEPRPSRLPLGAIPCPPFAQPARPPLQVLRSWEEDQGDGSSRQLSYHDLVTHMFAVLKQLRLKLDTQPTDGPVW